ncbi:MAG: hypothetical protein KJ622_00005 [Alphaproteobacteria bacterium]|nr:hypothetical protein [Alphaproteobacteria bacterium]
MNTVNKLLISAAAALAMTATAVIAQEQSTAGEHKFEKAEAYYKECKAATSEEFAAIKDKIKAFTDAELMAETINDPEKLAALSLVVNDPHTIHVMANCATEPVMWETWMKNGTDYSKITSAMAKAMNPAGMMKWMMAPMNPALWTAAVGHMDAERYTKWATAAGNPTFYKPVTQMADPTWYETRAKWLSSSESYAPVTQMFAALVPSTSETKEAAKPAE